MSFSNSSFTIQGVMLLDWVDQLGLNEQVLTWLNEDHLSWLSETDATLIDAFVRLNQRDPSLIPEIQEEDFPGLLLNGQFHRSNAILFTLSERLANWEEAREAAFQLYQRSIAAGAYSHNFGDSSQQRILVQTSIALNQLAESEEEISAANQLLKETLQTARISFNGSNHSQLPRELLLDLLTVAIQQEALTEEELQDWLKTIRSVSNWGDHAEPTAEYLAILSRGEVQGPLYPAVVDPDTIRPMVVATPLLTRDDRSGKEFLFDATFIPSDPATSLFATPEPSAPPFPISTDLPLREALAMALPDGFGYLLITREGESPENRSRSSWAPISLLPNLIPQPDPAAAPLSGDSTVSREGWAKLPTDRMISVTLPADAPIRNGTCFLSNIDSNRKTLISDKIPLNGQSDFLLSGWFGGTSEDGSNGYASFGLTFFDKDGKPIRTYSEWVQIPFQEVWTPLSMLYTAKNSSRKGRFSYPPNADSVAVQLEINPGVIFGNLHFSELPSPKTENALDVSQQMNNAAKAAREGESAQAAELFLQSLEYDPGQAMQYWRENDDVWYSALESSGRLNEIFAFLARPEIHDQSSFRYYNRTVRASGDLADAAALAIRSPELPASREFLDAVFQGDTCLNEAQKNQLHLKARAAGIESGTPEDNLDLGLHALGILKSNKNPRSPSPDDWNATLLDLEQLGLLTALLETLQDPEAPLPSDSTQSLLIQAWILASTDPQLSSDLLQNLTEHGEPLNDDNQERAGWVILRLASNPNGMEAAQDALQSISTSSGGSEKEQAQFRLIAWKNFVEAQSNPSPAMLASLKEAQQEALLLAPEQNYSEVLNYLKELAREQDFESMQTILEACAGIDRFSQTLSTYQNIVPRLTKPEAGSFWPIVLAGPADTEGNRTLIVRFHPDNDFAPDFVTGGPVRLTPEPILESIPGLERTEIRFGPFPNDLETVAEVSGDSASRDLPIQLPAANGFLRAVAYVDGREVPGPITPVFSGEAQLFDPAAGTTPVKEAPFTARPPHQDDLIPFTKSNRFYPDFPEIDDSQSDVIILTWALSVGGNPSLYTSPKYDEYDSVAPYGIYIRQGELSFLSALVPGESGKEQLGALEKVYLRIPDRSELAPLQILVVERSQSEYLLWMAQVRELAVRIEAGESVPPEEIIALASRDPYGSAGYLLESVIPAILETAGIQEAIAYLQDLDPANASPFHQSRTYHFDIRSRLRSLLQSEDLPADLRWEAALTTLRIGNIPPLDRIDYLYEAAGTNPERLAFAREQLIEHITGSHLPTALADLQLRGDAQRFYTSRTRPRNRLSEVLRWDYDADLDALIRKRLIAVNIDLEKDPGKDFVFVTLLADPDDAPRISAALEKSLSAGTSLYTLGLTTVVGIENLSSRGFSTAQKEALYQQALDAFLQIDPQTNQHDPSRGIIMVTGGALRNDSQPPVETMVEVAEWITAATTNPRTQDYFLCSSSTYLLIDFLEQAGQSEIRQQLLDAIRAKTKDSR
ncbi:MAG: hypothetical protein ACQKBT_11010, partial [Puniceicoccales bacterium]